MSWLEILAIVLLSISTLLLLVFSVSSIIFHIGMRADHIVERAVEIFENYYLDSYKKDNNGSIWTCDGIFLGIDIEETILNEYGSYKKFIKDAIDTYGKGI